MGPSARILIDGVNIFVIRVAVLKLMTLMLLFAWSSFPFRVISFMAVADAAVAPTTGTIAFSVGLMDGSSLSIVPSLLWSETQ